MSQHVGVYRKAEELASVAEALDQLVDGVGRQWAALTSVTRSPPWRVECPLESTSGML
jgi:hypothetical protein